ncbi:MAG: hypothetical protein CMJ40_02740, partial [Phycisphaerae bacterium]|nr:hypothetical protein [Phycisphaerae bacterium]
MNIKLQAYFGSGLALLCLLMSLMSNLAMAEDAKPDKLTDQDKRLFDLCWSESTTVDQIQSAIKAGGKVDSRDDNGWTPLMMASESNTHPAVIEALLKAGADVHVHDTKQDHWTPLMVAAAKNSNPKVIELLLKSGAKL